ncbi:MAG: nicotinate (nicotinamide) nucleotide adenylyltransferase [Gemmatimonadales bacterium]
MLGGTFDPPHIGHLIIAQDLVEGLALDRLLIVPAGYPPHRDPILPARARHALAVDAFRGVDGVQVTDIEMRRAVPSYTVDTLATVREEYAPRELFCAIGVDQLRRITTWHEYERLPELARLAVMARGEDRDIESAASPVPYEMVEVTRIDLSSTRIRDRLAHGRSIRYLVPESIRARVQAAWRNGAAPLNDANSDFR